MYIGCQVKCGGCGGILDATSVITDDTGLELNVRPCLTCKKEIIQKLEPQLRDKLTVAENKIKSMNGVIESLGNIIDRYEEE